jgi:hypothetical protein
MLTKMLSTICVLCVLGFSAVNAAEQPIGCASPMQAVSITPADAQVTGQYRSYSYQPGGAAIRSGTYSMPRNGGHQRSYENAVNKSLGRVN